MDACSYAVKGRKYMKVTFIHHSSFLAETESALLLFDYFRGSLPELDKGRTLYVLASHSHGDHYGKVIFSLPERHPDVRYILSSDIPESDIPAGFKCPVAFVEPHQEYTDGHLMVWTLKSNDRGVTFVCEADGKRIYHGGDLNNWCWDDGEVAKEDERIYHEELGRIQGMKFDAAFVPVDTRLKDYQLGVVNFMEHADAAAIFPMHLWDKFGAVRALRGHDAVKAYRDRIMMIEKDGQTFEVSAG